LFHWMLRGWLPPLWAFSGGLLCVFKFGPLSPWMNSYPDSLIPAGLICLILGLLPRLFPARLKGLRNPGRPFSSAAQLLVLLCVAQFVFWYGLHLCAPGAVVAAMSQYEAWP